MHSIEEAQSGTSPVPECQDGLWLRLLRSLRLSLVPGHSLKRPIREATLRGGTDF